MTLSTRHTTREASMSKAGVKGISVVVILRKSPWSQKSVWQKIYDKPTVGKRAAFSNSYGDFIK